MRIFAVCQGKRHYFALTGRGGAPLLAIAVPQKNRLKFLRRANLLWHSITQKSVFSLKNMIFAKNNGF